MSVADHHLPSPQPDADVAAAPTGTTTPTDHACGGGGGDNVDRVLECVRELRADVARQAAQIHKLHNVVLTSRSMISELVVANDELRGEIRSIKEDGGPWCDGCRRNEAAVVAVPGKASPAAGRKAVKEKVTVAKAKGKKRARQSGDRERDEDEASDDDSASHPGPTRIAMPKGESPKNPGVPLNKEMAGRSLRTQRKAKPVNFFSFERQLEGGKDGTRLKLRGHGFVLENGRVLCKTCRNESVSFAKHMQRHVRSERHRGNLRNEAADPGADPDVLRALEELEERVRKENDAKKGGGASNVASEDGDASKEDDDAIKEERL